MKRETLIVMFSCAALAAVLTPVAAQATCCPGCDCPGTDLKLQEVTCETVGASGQIRAVATVKNCGMTTAPAPFDVELFVLCTFDGFIDVKKVNKVLDPGETDTVKSAPFKCPASDPYRGCTAFVDSTNVATSECSELNNDFSFGLLCTVNNIPCCPGCDPLFPIAPTIPYECPSPPGGTFETCL